MNKLIILLAFFFCSCSYKEIWVKRWKYECISIREGQHNGQTAWMVRWMTNDNVILYEIVYDKPTVKVGDKQDHFIIR